MAGANGRFAKSGSSKSVGVKSAGPAALLGKAQSALARTEARLSSAQASAAAATSATGGGTGGVMRAFYANRRAMRLESLAMRQRAGVDRLRKSMGQAPAAPKSRAWGPRYPMGKP